MISEGVKNSFLFYNYFNMLNWLKRVSRKFTNAMKGMVVMVREEKSLWVHLFIAAIVLIISALFDNFQGFEAWEWISIILAIALVISFEIMNTAIEYLVDIVSFEYNVKAKKIKDVAAMATLVVTIVAILIGLIIFIPHFIVLFGG